MRPFSAKDAAAKAWCAFNLVTFTIGTEGSNTIKVTVTLLDAQGQAVGFAFARCYLSDNADGSTLTATATTSALAIATKGVLLDIPTTGKVCDVISNNVGVFDLNIIQTATPTYYLVVILPDGTIVVSDAITFA